MNNRITAQLTALAAVALLTFGASQAFAGGTVSGTDISNSATLDFTVGTIPQTQKSSNTVTFKVDKKVDLTVTASDGALVQVTPGATDQVLTFSVTNTGNDTQDIHLSAIPEATGTADPFGGSGTDNFDATDVGIFVESGATAGYQSAEDTATYIDEMAPDVPQTVYIVRNIAISRADSDIAVYALVGEARIGGTASAEGAALTPTTAGNETDGAVDILFADGNGSDDIPNDAKYSARSAFLVVSATMTIDKSALIDDGSGGAFAIPGATVSYTILVTNNGSANATAVTISDPKPANTTYVANSLSCTSGTPKWSIDGTNYNGAPEPAAASVTNVQCDGATVNSSGGTATMAFGVTIN